MSNQTILRFVMELSHDVSRPMLGPSFHMRVEAGTGAVVCEEKFSAEHLEAAKRSGQDVNALIGSAVQGMLAKGTMMIAVMEVEEKSKVEKLNKPQGQMQ